MGLTHPRSSLFGSHVENGTWEAWTKEAQGLNGKKETWPPIDRVSLLNIREAYQWQGWVRCGRLLWAWPQINLERSSLSDRNGLPLKVTPQRIPVDPEICLSNLFLQTRVKQCKSECRFTDWFIETWQQERFIKLTLKIIYSFMVPYL